jgi:adenine-specific DNA methylase
MNDKPRLIEVAFPLKHASLDSVHEKNVRHGHISTLHIWPARRPLAACRAALIATLLPDPGDAEERAKILEKLGGHVVPTVKKKQMPNGKVEEIKAKETTGGILHWGRESGPDLEWFRDAIRKAYDGRAPKVLDPFAGGGAIPLEAMRLGCEATAIDINPVAWFVLKCTLEYPQKLAGKKLPLPEFILEDREFMEKYCKAHKMPLPTKHTKDTKREGENQQGELNDFSCDFVPFVGNQYEADLAWHVRAWGKWVLKQARKELAEFYPTYATWEPVLETEKRKVPKTWLAEWKKDHAAEIEAKGLRLCPMTPDGEVDGEELNKEFSAKYLAEPTNPRWVPKPTVAYLWARTVKNKHHPETTIPLLKTRWLCKKDDKRVLLTMTPKADGTGAEFGIEKHVPKVGGNTAQRREHDKKIGAGTMSRSGVTCPVHGNIMTMPDIQVEGRAGQIGETLTAVVLDGPLGKEYRLPTERELRATEAAGSKVDGVFGDIPFGLPIEGIVEDAKRNTWCVQYGVDSFDRVFSKRQLVCLGAMVKHTRASWATLKEHGYSPDWIEGIAAYLAVAIDRMADAGSKVAHWQVGNEFNVTTFQWFALPMAWDFAEVNTFAGLTGSYDGAINWIQLAIQHFALGEAGSPAPHVLRQSSIKPIERERFDLVLTDPPYYDAIGYAVLMDFFYVWLRRTLQGLSGGLDDAFRSALSPKWDHDECDGELVDDASRFGGDREKSKKSYEDGMAKVFENCRTALKSDGRLVIVFANKQPDAWETLVGAIIRAGFVVDGSWPIQTERGARTRSLTSAALSSSVWLVCKKRNPAARPGWDNAVLQQMRERIRSRLRDFWDAEIRGPDFVWAATGPAMEAYSQYPVVKKANKPNELMSVSEFLRHVRRMVLDFVVGRLLYPQNTQNTQKEDQTGSLLRPSAYSAGSSPAGNLEMDDVTTYYLLHRNDFKMDEAPAGACILYCVSCNLSDRDLVDAFDLLVPAGKAEGERLKAEGEEEEETGDEEEAEGSGSAFKLKPWNKRKRPGMGYDPVLRSPRNPRNTRKEENQDSISCHFVTSVGNPSSVGVVPLIDQIHRLMHLWKAGDVVKVDEYLNSKSLRTNALFPPVLQAVIEMADAGSEERSILESLSNHVQGRSVRAAYQPELPTEHTKDTKGEQ